MKQPIIGLDLGNFKTFICCVDGFDPVTGKGGTEHDLLPDGLTEGIPSVFFYSKDTGILCCEDALRTCAKPAKNGLRYLKRQLGKSFDLDGKTFPVFYMITQVAQHSIRSANDKLKKGWMITSNQVMVAYPATYSHAQLQILIEAIEKATLIDGTPVKVCGTIKEPAAAALDYLSEYSESSRDTTVLVYDLGGGTFDLSLVCAYPSGKKDREGKVYYYDNLDNGGLANVGGAEFSDIMYDLLCKKFNVPLKPFHEDILRDLSEKVKIDLSKHNDAVAEMVYSDDFISVTVTREEFEKASEELLMKTIAATKKMLQKHPHQRPEYILITGGAGQMPMVKKALEAELPEYKGKIKDYRPSRAIAYGAARFGTKEGCSDPVIQRTVFDLGVRFFHGPDDDKGFISTFIPAGTPIPYESPYESSSTIYENQRYSCLRVYEANKDDPDISRVEDDYTEIMHVTIDHERGVPKGTKNLSRLIIDKRNLLTIEAREADKPDKPPLKNHVELKNLS